MITLVFGGRARHVWPVIALALLVLSTSVVISTAYAADVWDSFDREGPALGTTEDTNQYGWVVNGDATIVNNEMKQVASYVTTAGIGPNASSVDFTPADFDMTVRVKMGGGWFGILFRQPTTDAWFTGDGYMPHFYPASPSGGVLYYWGMSFGVIQTASLDGFTWDDYHTVRLRVVGDSHRLWLDGKMLINLRHAGKTTAGHIGLGCSAGTAYFDDVSITVNPPPLEKGNLVGTVTDADTGAPVEGCIVQLPGVSTSTNASGYYQFVDVDAGEYQVGFTHTDYRIQTKTAAVVAGDQTVLDAQISKYDLGSPVAVITDTFTRDDDKKLGRTEDDGHYPWVLGNSETAASILAQRLNLGSGPTYTGACLSGIYPADFDASFDIRQDNAGVWSGVVYRSFVMGNDDVTAYKLYVTPMSLGVNGRIDLFRNWNYLAQVTTGVDFSSPHKLRVRALGDRHQVWLDDTKIIDLVDFVAGHREAGGYFGFMRYQSNTDYDNLDLKVYSATVPGSVRGKVLKAGTNEPVAWLPVYSSNSASTLTGSDGSYVIEPMLQPTTLSVWAILDGYYAPPVQVSAGPGETAVADIVLQPIQPQSLEVTDTFGRADSGDIGVTEDAAHYPWVKGFAEPAASISGGSLLLDAGGGGTGVSIGGYCPVDLDAAVDITMSGNQYWAGIQYRAPALGAQGTTGYVAYVTPVTLVDGVVDLYKNGGAILQRVTTGIDFATPHRLRVQAIGPSHKVWIDDNLLIDLVDEVGTVGSGTVSLLRHSVAARFDNLNVTRLPVTEARSVAEAKGLPDGTTVSLVRKVVTGQFERFLYVEDVNRASGIKVSAPLFYDNNILFSVGELVTVYGTVETDDGERYIAASGISRVGFASVLPVGVNGKALASEIGLSSVGLLVGTWGEVKSVDFGTSAFAIDDGSGKQITVVPTASGVIPSEGDFVGCIGVLGMQDGAAVLRMRFDTDMTPYQQ